MSGDVQTLNAEVEKSVKPWWTRVDGVNGYDCSKDVKAKKQKGKLSKIEWKELTEAKTLHYLKNSDQGAKLAAVLGAANQCKMYFKGGKVSELYLFVALKLFITLTNLSCFLYLR